MQFRQEQEEVDSALCSPASGRAGWEDSLASGCPAGRLCAGQGVIPPDEAEKSGPNFRKPTGVGRMKGVIWHVYRNQEKGMIRGDDGEQVLPKVCVARSGLSLSFLWSARELSDSGRLAWQRSRRSPPIADRENRRRRLSRRLGQNVEAREKFRGLKRRCKNARFRYATEQEDWLWFHPQRRWF